MLTVLPTLWGAQDAGLQVVGRPKAKSPLSRRARGHSGPGAGGQERRGPAAHEGLTE